MLINYTTRYVESKAIRIIEDDLLGTHEIVLNIPTKGKLFSLIEFYHPHGTVVENVMRWMLYMNLTSPERHLQAEFELFQNYKYISYKTPIMNALEKLMLLC